MSGRNGSPGEPKANVPKHRLSLLAEDYAYGRPNCFNFPNILISMLDVGIALTVNGVRWATIFEHANDMIDDVCWRDPFGIDVWAGDLDRTCEFVGYCVNGHEVRQNSIVSLWSKAARAR